MSNLTPSISKFILPFSVLSKNRTDPFTSEMELAAIFALAELGRDKGGGLLSKRQEEEILFISKIGYPLWLIPLFEKPLLFDGLNRFKYKMVHAKIPNVKLFIDNLKRSSNSCETHLAFLSDHVNFFETPIEEKETIIKGLISDSDFLEEFDSYYYEGKKIEEKPDYFGLLPQILENIEISSGLEDLKTIYNYIKENKDRLYRCMKLLKKINAQQIEYLKSIIGETKYRYKEMIKKEEKIVNPQIVRLKKEYDYQVIKTTKTFQRQELPLYKEKIKLQKSTKVDQIKIDNCKFEALRCAEKNDKTGEQKWKERRKRTKKIVSESSKNLKEIEKKIEILTERKTSTIFKLKSDLETKIKDLQQKMRDLEASLEAKVIGYNQDVEKLQKNSQIIIGQLGRFTKIEETDLTEFTNLSLKENPELKKSRLYYIPFYVVCYKIESKKRYHIIPPSIINTVCLTTKLKSLGRSKIKQLFSDRFYNITSLVDELIALIEQNHMFQTEIYEIGKEHNVLTKNLNNIQIKKGLTDLKNEGWISEKEYENIIPKQS